MNDFGRFLALRSTSILLDRLLEENRQLDEEIARRKAQNEETYNRAIRAMFEKEQ